MIAVECYADTRVVLTLGATAAMVDHARGKGQVLDILRNERAVVGVVDEDPGSSEYPEMRNYRLADQLGGLRLMRHVQADGRRLIVICPRLEEWLLGRAQVRDVNPENYGLASDARKLHGSGRYDRKPKFRDFIEALLSVDTELQRLRDWLLP